MNYKVEFLEMLIDMKCVGLFSNKVLTTIFFSANVKNCNTVKKKYNNKRYTL